MGKELFDCRIVDVIDEMDLICFADDMRDIFGFTTVQHCVADKFKVFKDHTLRKASKIGEDGRPVFLEHDGIRGSKEMPSIMKYGNKQHMSEDFQYWMNDGCPCDNAALSKSGIGDAAYMTKKLAEALKIAEMADMFALLFYSYNNDAPGNQAGSGGFFGDPLIGVQAGSGGSTNELLADGVALTDARYEALIAAGEETKLEEHFKDILDAMKRAALCQQTPNCQPMCAALCHTIYAGRKLARVLRKTMGILNLESGCCLTTNSCGQSIAIYGQNPNQANPTISDFLYEGQGFKLVEVPFFSKEWFKIFELDESKLPSDATGVVADPDWMYWIFDVDYLRKNEVFVRVESQEPAFRSYVDYETEKYVVASKARF